MISKYERSSRLKILNVHHIHGITVQIYKFCYCKVESKKITDGS